MTNLSDEPEPMPSTFNVVVDVWGGTDSQEHVARDFLSLPLALERAECELARGYLVNMRPELAWGPATTFDKRQRN